MNFANNYNQAEQIDIYHCEFLLNLHRRFTTGKEKFSFSRKTSNPEFSISGFLGLILFSYRLSEKTFKYVSLLVLSINIFKSLFKNLSKFNFFKISK